MPPREYIPAQGQDPGRTLPAVVAAHCALLRRNHLDRRAFTALQGAAGNVAVSRLVAGTPLVQRDPEPNPMWLAMSEAVFRDRVGGTDVSRRGQMMWGVVLYPAVTAALNAAVDAFPTAERTRLRPPALSVLAATVDPDQDKPALEKQLAAELNKSPSKSAAQRLHALALNRAHASKEAGLELWVKLQTQFRATRSIPDVTAHATVGRMIGLRLWENLACYLTADALAALFYDAGGFGHAPDKRKAILPTTISAGVTRNRATGTGGNDAVLGDVVTYKPSLPKTMEKVYAALDDGALVHARVLSGVSGPGEEHSIVLIAHSGDVIRFADPDAAGGEESGRGFGNLYFDRGANRLSTAAQTAELPVWSRDDDQAAPVHHDGWHASKQVHRYQVLRLWTITPAAKKK